MNYDPGGHRLRKSKDDQTDSVGKPAEPAESSDHINSDIDDASSKLNIEELNILAAKMLLVGESLGAVADELAATGLDRNPALKIARFNQDSLRDEEYRSRMKQARLEHWEGIRKKPAYEGAGKVIAYVIFAVLVAAAASLCESA